MKLIIAEKPSLARNIAAAVGSMKKSGSYFENSEYIVTWVFGHLFSLADIEYYNPSPDGSRRWTRANIPCFPEKFEFELRRGSNGETDAGVRRQFEVIKTLCNRDDVTMIINAGDSDREGEIIVRICIEKALTGKKTLKRLWMPDQTAETISAALADLPDEANYDNLADEGYARTYTDWLYGVNLTRYATLKSGRFLRVGRVIVPIVKAIYDRDKAIRDFVPDIYYAVISEAETNGEKVELTSKNKFKRGEKDKACVLCDKYNAQTAAVKDKKIKRETLNPGKLYSLSKLQNVLGKKYKMPMDESLKILQDLYEKGFVTYPRTNSEYLATAEKDKIRAIVNAVAGLGYPVIFKDKKTIFDDKKIESHSALTPTYKIPSKNELSEREYKVYGTIMRRFAAVFCSEDCIAEKTELVIDVGGMEEFTLRGTVIAQRGWTKYDDYTKKDKLLPKLEKGDRINTDFRPAEKETNPPKHYTIETLNNYLKNPFREEKARADEEDDSEEYRAMFEGLELGTEATRTGIIDNAQKSGYIQLKKDVYTILPDGEKLIEHLSAMNISMDKYKTSQLGQALKKVFRGEMSVDDSVQLAVGEIKEIFGQKSVSIEDDTDYGFIGDVAGSCPVCGKPVVRTKFGYGCSGYREGCKFAVNGMICSRVISLANMRMLLDTGRTSVIRGFVSPRTKNKFDAALKIDGGRAVFDF